MWFGVVLVAVGLCGFLDAAGVVDSAQTIGQWWPLAIVGWPLVEMAAAKRVTLGGAICAAVGVTLLADVQAWASDIVGVVEPGRVRRSGDPGVCRRPETRVSGRRVGGRQRPDVQRHARQRSAVMTAADATGVGHAGTAHDAGRSRREPAARSRAQGRRLGRHPDGAARRRRGRRPGRDGLARRREPVARGGGSARRPRRRRPDVGGGAGLGKQLTPFPRPIDDGNLRQDGVYGLVRHPMYGGALLLMLGWALLSSPLALVPLVAAAAFLDAKRRREEAWLNGEFAGYADYRRTVRRQFIPFVW